MYSNKPRTVFCSTDEQVAEMVAANPGSRALTTGPGSLSFHLTIAQHGAGEFETLYVAPAARGKFAPPVGGIIEEI
jgi:hypothetical protein